MVRKKKNTTEKKEARQPKPHEISFRVENGKIVFEMKGGGPAFWMSAEGFLRLINHGFMKSAIEQEKAGPDLTLEKYCLIKRLQYKGLNFSHISKVLDMPLEQLTEAYQRFLNTLPETPDGRECEKVLDEIERQRLNPDEMDFCKTVPVKDDYGREVAPAGQKLVDMAVLRRLLNQGKSLKEAAADLNLDFTDLRKFNAKNIKYERYLR